MYLRVKFCLFYSTTPVYVFQVLFVKFMKEINHYIKNLPVSERVIQVLDDILRAFDAD